MDPREALHTLDQALESGLALIGRAVSMEELEQAEIAAFGRKSSFSQVQRSLGALPEEDRREVGRRANDVREALRRAIEDRSRTLEEAEERRLFEEDRVDVTLPGRRPRPGSLHPLTIVEQEILDVFTRMGYRVVEGPEVETDWYNYEALNFPSDHPARTMQDTLYVDVEGRSDLLLRTHTSPVQIRAMQAQSPPVYVVVPGRCFRHDTPDATHSPVFHQVECLAVDEGITFADMKGTLEEFARALFGPDQRIRLTPDYFPFVEPGAQVAVTCFLCGGSGCRTCKWTGWIEILGAGMVHPALFENVGYDPERYTGFAFGLGIERVAMLKYGIPDIRMLFEGDVRFLEQFEAAG
jgi:phenylalanyl-tRNA synthetase alpha chain